MLMRTAASLLALLLLAVSSVANALGLGAIELASNLNQPLNAKIPLRSAEATDVADVRVTLASREQFRRAGLERPYVLSRLRFKVVRSPGGETSIHVTTQEPLREPFLDFLLEVNWPSGRVIREYTVLLDPPVYGAAVSSGVQEPVTTVQKLPPLEGAPSVSQASAARAEPEAAAGAEPEAAAPPPSPAPTGGEAIAGTAEPPVSESTAAPTPPGGPEDRTTAQAGAGASAEDMSTEASPAGTEGAQPETSAEGADRMGSSDHEGTLADRDEALMSGGGSGVGEGDFEDIGPSAVHPPGGASTYSVGRGDTLWSLAERYRPRDSVSVQQTMLAILAANPEAFSQQNINSLRAGAVLQMPELQAIALSKDEAMAEVKRQNALWEEYRRSLTGQVGQAPEGVVAASDIDAGEAAGSGTAAQAEPQADSDDDSARLQVVATGSAVEHPEGSTPSENSHAPSDLRKELNLSLEQIDAIRQENNELKARLEQQEALVEDLKRLIDLKDDNIAALQRRLGGAGEQPATAMAGDDFAAETETATQTPTEPQAGFSETVPEAPAATTPEPATARTPEPATPTGTEGAGTAPGDAQAQAGGQAQVSGAAATQPVPGNGEQRPGAAGGAGEHTASPGGSESAGTGHPTSAAGNHGEATEQVAMLGETGSPGGVATTVGAGGPKAKTVPGAAPSFLDSTLATLSALATSALVMGKSFGSSLGSSIGTALGSAREAIPALPGSVPGDPRMLAAAGGVLLLGGAWVIARRRRAGAAEVVDIQPGPEDEFEDGGEASAFTGVDALDDGSGSVAAEAASVAQDTNSGAEAPDDPLAEVNVYLAYERFDQAEALVRDAIEQHPDRQDYKLKLLEVAYAAKNLDLFEDGARALQDAVGPESTLMKKATGWWRELSPDRALFASAPAQAPAEEDEGAASELDRIFEVTDEVEEAGADTRSEEGRSTDVDFDIGTEESSSESEGEDEVTGGDLDFDLGAVESQGEATNDDLDFSLGEEQAAAEEDAGGTVQGMDFSLDEGADAAADEAQQAVPEHDEAAPADDNALDFDLSGIDLPAREEPAAGDTGLDLEFEANDAGSNEELAESQGSESDGVDFDLEETYVQADQDESLDFGLGGDESVSDSGADDGLGFDLGDDGGFAESLESGTDEDVGLDLGDEGGFDDSAESLASGGDDDLGLELGESMDSGGDDDLGFDLGSDDAAGDDLDMEDFATVKLSDAGDDADLSLEMPDAGQTEESVASASAESSGGDFDLDMSAFEMDAGDGQESALDVDDAGLDAGDDDAEKTQYMLRDPDGESETSSSADAFKEMSGDADAIQTKLDLALAYIDMGDADGARSILDEVMVEGNDAQKKSAEELLTKLD